MERCSNCGAPAKSGAKFCTSCGARLVQRPESESESGAWGDTRQEEDRSSTAWAWSYETEKPPPDADSGIAGDVKGEDGAGQAETAVDDGAASELAAEGDAAEDKASAEDQSGAMEGAPEWQVAEPDTSWAAGWSAQYGAESQEAGSPVAGEPDAEPSGAADMDREEFAQLGEDHIVETAPATESTHGSERPPDDVGDGDPTERAITLLDELRGVVTILGSQQEAAGAKDMIALASELEAVRHQPGEELAEEIEGLRAALDDAHQRPRDVDTMLDLMGRLDVIVAMQEAHDRYAQAIDRAIRRLKGESGGDGAG